MASPVWQFYKVCEKDNSWAIYNVCTMPRPLVKLCSHSVQPVNKSIDPQSTFEFFNDLVVDILPSASEVTGSNPHAFIFSLSSKLNMFISGYSISSRDIFVFYFVILPELSATAIDWSAGPSEDCARHREHCPWHSVVAWSPRQRTRSLSSKTHFSARFLI